MDRILRLKKTALQEAKLLEDAVLDKAHPQLRIQFREEYQKGIEAYLRGSEKGDAKAEQESADLHEAWACWYDENRTNLRVAK